MTKPKIEVKPVDKFPQMGDHFWVNGKALTLDQIQGRYSDMVDALVEAYETLIDLGVSLDISTVKQVDIIESALKKAGAKS